MTSLNRSLSWAGRHASRVIARLSGAAWQRTRAGSAATTRAAYRYRREILGGALATGTAAAYSIASASRALLDLYGNWGYSERRLARVRGRIESQAHEYSRLARQQSGSLATVDSIAVGGDILRTYLDEGHTAPEEILQAYRLTYPEEASLVSFSDKVRSLDDTELVGFASAVKGKLFELRYVDWLNDGNLPSGYTASLAITPTQAGWDISVSGPDGQIARVLQAKATESASYVSEAIQKYPHIDVVTTDEVYSHLVLQGAADSVSPSGIANAELSADVAEALGAAGLTVDFGVPIVSLALIAFTSYTLPETSAFSKARHAGSRIGYSYLSFLAGQGVFVITQTWWLGLLAGVGSRYALARGRKRRNAWRAIKRIERTNRSVLRRMRSLAPASD